MPIPRQGWRASREAVAQEDECDREARKGRRVGHTIGGSTRLSPVRRLDGGR